MKKSKLKIPYPQLPEPGLIWTGRAWEVNPKTVNLNRRQEMSNEQKIEKFAKLVSKEQLERLNKDYPKNLERNPDFWKKNAITSIKPGRKYIKVDVGASGKFMIDEDGNIFGIKAYGVIHRGHHYGTLDTIDQYYWGEYYPEKK